MENQQGEEVKEASILRPKRSEERKSIYIYY